MHRRELLSSLLVVAASGCRPPDPAVGRAPRATRREAHARLAELARRYERLMQDHGKHEWSRYAGLSPEGPATRAALERLRAEEHDVFREAEAVLKRFGNSLVSPRQAELWQKGALGLALLADSKVSTLSDELEALINAHRFELDGKVITRAELSELRRSDDPRVRRRTRQVEHELHKKAKPVAEALLARRRELAKALGKPSYYAALLQVRGADVARTEAILTALSVRTRRAFADMLGPRQRRVARAITFAWDIDYMIARQASVPHERFPRERALPVALGIYRAFGFDLEHPPLDLRVREFAFGGQTVALRVPDDVRLVVRAPAGARYVGLLLHELGHAVAVRTTRVTHPLYKGYEWVPGLLDPAYAEGSAEIFGRLLDEPGVLREHLGLSDEEARTLIAGRRLEALVAVRRSAVASAFERAALEQERADLDALSLDLERRLSGTIVPRDAEPTWAASPFLASYPVYTHAYSLALCVAAQVRQALKSRFASGFLGRDAGEHLGRAFFADGARSKLDEKMVRTTGAPLSESDAVRFLLGRS